VDRRQVNRTKIANRLKQAREQAGYISAEAFCHCHQLDVLNYLALEAGQKVIQASQAIEICKLLNITLDFLFLGQ
jgi:hypothetical protein